MLFFKSSRLNLIVDQPESKLDSMIKSAELKTSEGRLAIDVYKTEGALVVRSTIAGAKIEDLEILIDNELLIIKGRRSEPEEIDYLDYLYRECYWGNFSRSIVLPVSVNEDEIEADLDNGVLTIILPIRTTN